MKKIRLSLLLAVLMSMVSNTAFAHVFEVDGIYYNYGHGGSLGTTVSVTYKGTYNSQAYSGEVIIPDSVVYNGKTYSVTSIGNQAFWYCSGLTSVTIPNSVTSIGGGAFKGCSGLTSVTIPYSVTLIGQETFHGSGIYDNSPDGVFYVDHWVCGYKGEKPTGSLDIEEGTRGIAVYAFADCTGLTSVNIPESVTTIGSRAFEACRGLTSVTIPETVTSVGSYAFVGTPWYDNLPDGLIYIGKVAYKYKGTMPEGTSIIFKDGTTEITEEAFWGYCSGLISVIIPESVTHIGYNAFYCNNLVSVTVEAKTPPAVDNDVQSDWTFSNHANATLYVPKGCKALYEATGYYKWNGFKEIVEFDTEAEFTMNAFGKSTYCNTQALDFTDVEGLKAYIASGFSPSTGELTFTRVNHVPAGEGLYLTGDAGSYMIPYKRTDMFYANLLKGVTTATTIAPTEGDYTNFILRPGKHGVAFYTIIEGEIEAGKAYLQLPTSAVQQAKIQAIVFDDENDGVATGIVDNNQYTITNNQYFDLQGRRVLQPQCGVYIMNGKKVVVK